MKVKIGDKFGRLTALEPIEEGKYMRRTWRCACECGRETIVKERYLKDGHRKSCGCLVGKHMITHGDTKTRLFKIWTSMRERCESERHKHFKDYGARGIKVCDEWQDAGAFCEWALNNGYKEGLQIDRIDNDGNYEPSNCRFVTLKENARNRRNTVYLTVNGITKPASEWSEVTGISSYTIYWWVKKKGKEYAEQRISEKI